MFESSTRPYLGYIFEITKQMPMRFTKGPKYLRAVNPFRIQDLGIPWHLDPNAGLIDINDLVSS